jgi:hypothetical protein
MTLRIKSKSSGIYHLSKNSVSLSKNKLTPSTRRRGSRHSKFIRHKITSKIVRDEGLYSR